MIGPKVQLELFEGPLDLLLYLIKKEELNIYDIPITKITEQYLQYLDAMQELNLDVAGEFLVMAATLMQIKSKMLLPVEENVEQVEEDPRSELVRRLLEYKSYKEAADKLRDFEAQRNKTLTRFGVEPAIDQSALAFEEVPIFALLSAFTKILNRFPKESFHEVIKDEYTVSDKISQIRHYLRVRSKVHFSQLFSHAKNKYEVITIFLAILELIKVSEISATQSQRFGDIELYRKNSQDPIVDDAETIQEGSTDDIG